MSYCVDHGKDKVIFLSKEDLEKPSTIELPEDDEPGGLLLPNGEINWSCPCLGNMVIGPCNVEFRESLSCFHKSTAEPRGSDCLEKFRDLNDCMAQYPKLYAREDDEERRELEQMEFENESANKELDDKEAEQATQISDIPSVSTDSSVSLQK